MRRALVPGLVFSLGFLTVFAGCTWKGGPLEGDGSGVEVWRVRPVRMRVYPGTRFVREGEKVLLVARVELFDELGDQVKGVGRFRVELHHHDRLRPERMGQLLYQWPVEMLTREKNRELWDPVTRTYRLRLEVHNEDVAVNQVRVRVVFSPVRLDKDGGRFTAEALVGGDPLHERASPPTKD